MKRRQQGCPGGGYPDPRALDGSGEVTCSACPCCGAESGCDYGAEPTEERLLALRRRWFIDLKGKWWSAKQPPPQGWNPQTQLQMARMKVPPA